MWRHNLYFTLLEECSNLIFQKRDVVLAQDVVVRPVFHCPGRVLEAPLPEARCCLGWGCGGTTCISPFCKSARTSSSRSATWSWPTMCRHNLYFTLLDQCLNLLFQKRNVALTEDVAAQPVFHPPGRVLEAPLPEAGCGPG
ncbi:hypothetical protein NDU88_000225 [Pleurodeles waltl]|uniref:Uncharacterized protein n=1 Tax=Pleurodeles waltl TaxID=8319 RepID=A0AAV7Q2N0_PLEWA|nr:hypothetical protein NDU88_000225 [Pleurodeles waltl]